MGRPWGRWLCVVVIGIGFGAAGFAETYTDAALGYSYAVPRNWTLRDNAGAKVAVGPAEQGFRPNLSVVSQVFEGTLGAFIDTNLQAVAAYDPQSVVVSKATLKTDAGLPVLKVVLRSGPADRVLVQSFYFMAGPSRRYFVITGTAPAESRGSFDAIFDAAAKSFRLVSPPSP